MNDAVDRVLVDRAAEERGFGLGLGLSSAVHGAILVIGVAVPLLFPPKPRLEVADAFAVALPPGGAGTPNVPSPAAGQPAPAPPAPPVTQPPAPEPPAPDPKKILKPPKEEPRKGLADPDAKRPKKQPRERERVKPGATGAAPRSAAAGLPGATGSASQTPGLSFGPAGPGVPGGMDPNGDWYLASVQRKIWVVWTQQLRGANYPPVTIAFTIRGDGSLADVQRVQSSGIPSVDMAAERAIYSAAPFGPLPRMYGTDAYTIRAVFKPES